MVEVQKLSKERKIMDNFININSKDRNKKIYRIEKLYRLLEMFDIKINTLVKPKLWKDPFENFICSSPFKTKRGETYKFPLRDCAYGQCWTLIPESDAMWRIYAPNEDGVRIETTIKKLFMSLHRDNQYNYPYSSCFIGKVEYLKEEELHQLVNDPERIKELKEISDGISEWQARTLLIKRIEFKHEEEVRLLYIEPRNKADKDVYQYSYNPHDLIKSIRFDPRMDSRLFEVYKSHLKKIGYKGQVDQSKLYSLPQLTIAYE